MIKGEQRYCDRCGVELTEDNNKCGYELCDKCNKELEEMVRPKIENEKLKPIIDDILSYYFNQNTRFSHNSKTQIEMLNQNKGLTNACTSVINFAEKPNELLIYTKQKISEINEAEAQEVEFSKR